MTEALLVSNLILWVAVVVLAGVVAALVRQVGVLYERVAPAGALVLPQSLLAGEPAPQSPADPPDPARVRQLVVLDGTWRQARRLLQHSAALLALPRWSLPAARPVSRLRRPPSEEGHSTLEAIAQAMRWLEGEALGGFLEALHDDAVARVLRTRGR